MKQTAVELLRKQIILNSKFKESKTGKISFTIGLSMLDTLFEQAKAMEKEQIISAYETAMETDIYNEPLKIGKDYFNETYEQSK